MAGNEKYDELILKQISILTENLESTFKFLGDHQNEKGCWCGSKSNKTDLHLSALSIRAIKMIQTHDSDILLENALSHLKDIISKGASEFDEDTLIDSLNIIIDYSPRMIELENGVVTRLMDKRQEMGWGKPNPSLGLTCRALIALVRSDLSQKDIINRYIKQLIKAQYPDGGWSHRDSKGEIITTCYAMRALYHTKDSSLKDFILHGKNYLKKFLENSVWLNDQIIL